LRAAISLAAALVFASSRAADQPQWGDAWTRNLVSPERGLATTFDPETGANIKWVAKLGTESHGTAIVAGGRVFIGTNNEEPRDPQATGDRGVLMCFAEKDGAFLWQYSAPKREEDQFLDWPKTGMSSPITVEGERGYFVSNRGEVICLAVADGRVLWNFNLTTGAGIWSHDGAHSSILIRGPHLYLNSGTGVDNTHRVIRTPDAPSLVVLDKETGRLVARDDEHIAPNIFHCTWSSPSLAEVDGKPLVFFAGGDGIVRAFEPIPGSVPSGEVLKLRKVWQFDIDPTAPKENVHRFTGNKQQGPSDIFGMPVFANQRLFVAGGGDIWWGKNEAWLKCIDPRGSGDITKTNEVWSYPLGRHVMSTPTVADGLVFIADMARKFHCIDAANGTVLWTHDIKGEAWASALVADGKVYFGTRKGDFYIFAASREKQVLASVDFKRAISATATAANGVIYVATMTHLYAIATSANLERR
jgi:outer membrane protein assembly factor BamB